MIDRIILGSIKNKILVLLFTSLLVFFGIYSFTEIPIDAVPDVTNNQVQIITTSKNLSTQDVEKFLTYPIELELGNLPGVQEIRSVSKFGLSVITVVFPDEIGTYLPRQLISEKLKFAEEKIPEGFGKPFMGPITTGLGEIYQYVLEVEPEYKHRYSQSDLRTIQDWVIKRQLSGISGVVEINTWGGFLKQYEVAVNPERLRAIDVSLSDVFTALEKNNSIAGGSYIEKTNESYFIRGEGLITTIEDIKKVVITTRKGIPILIKDVAKVGFGYANRYGAITMDGKGETVLGQVMMLKGGNTNKIIKSVKERVVEIQKILPKGIKINPFLERSDLIAKTTFTIYENLIIGSVIVMFVVILLLGNLISALIVTSVIPLSLLFTLSCMYIFNVNANLLSLGAVDFGIIIDGAIIIIEYVAMTITKSRLELLGLPKVRQQHLRNTLTFSGTSKMMRSAIFGQVIIIIVFIPILSLVGVEGKMFRPMALVFCFALVGAMVLCFTYLPVIASIFLKPNLHDKKNFSDKVITRLELYYSKTLILALRNKKSVFISSLLAILISLILFFRVGGEFVPTLDEGSFVIQPVIKTGTSLTRTIELVTQMERILKGFPEVHHVVSRIGAAEIPTDPMSMEQSDVIITLKPKSEWTSAKTKDELANKFKEALSVIPDVDYEFTQPIEMRFNELITGVRADLAIKVFGENLDILQKKADEISAAIQNVEGASDIVVEKIAGLPQMLVEFDRNKIAKYGLNIADLNQIIKTSFSGTEAGLILEKDRQFDLVVRLDTDHRKTIEDIQTTTIKLPNGNTLPLREFANINYHTGPAQISRDNTHRRIVVTVNVRNRDLESVVNDVQTIVKNKISMPAGYFITYGGQFENLRQAKQRLSIALPTALLLIFVLLYFAFRSLKESLIIYSAIPLASVGGVFLLFLRDLPFSISAGIGFIALFGIAVLNGIVLIEEYNALKKHGMNNVLRRILTGSKLRLRPVLLTATAAAFGFLPMAFSGSVGAEVQRPLATVVIGGLISSTLLTLFVLPLLYSQFAESKKINFKPNKKKSTLSLIAILLITFFYATKINSQTVLTADDAVKMALEHNISLKIASKNILLNNQIASASVNIPKTDIFYRYDESTLTPNNLPYTMYGVSQSFQFPSIYITQGIIGQTRSDIAKNEYEQTKFSITKETLKAYYSVIYWKNVVASYSYLDSLLRIYSQAAKRKYKLGETNYTESLISESKHLETNLALNQSKENVTKQLILLQEWVQSKSAIDVPFQELPVLELHNEGVPSSLGSDYFHKTKMLSEYLLSLETQHMFLPDLRGSFVYGVNNAQGMFSFISFEVGISFPLFFFTTYSKIEAAKNNTQIEQDRLDNFNFQFRQTQLSLESDLKKYKLVVDYYKGTGKQLIKNIIENASKSLEAGEIDFFQYVQLLEQANSMELNYLQNLNLYNQTILDKKYLITSRK